jgi:hypothetical protein
MTHFWITLALAALIIMGVWTSFGEGMIFAKLGDWMEDNLHPYVNKPIFTCPQCMSSLWGGSIWIWSGGAWQVLPVFILALCGLMRLISDNLIKTPQD